LTWGQIGPKLVDEAIRRHKLEQFVRAPDVFNPVDYFAFRDIQAPGFDFQRIASSHGVHLWNQKWRSHCMDQDFDGAPDSLYASLRKQYLQPGDRLPSGAAAEAHLRFQDASINALVTERDELLYASESLERDVVSLRADVARERERSEQLRLERDRVQGELSGVINSLSWRLTAPMRRVVNLLTGKDPATRKP
jgi:hypothetical protein